MSEPPPFHRARREVADDNVGVLNQPLEDRGTLGMAQVQGNAAFAAVARGENGAARVAGLNADVAAQVAESREFDLDDIGAHIAEKR